MYVNAGVPAEFARWGDLVVTDDLFGLPNCGGCDYRSGFRCLVDDLVQLVTNQNGFVLDAVADERSVVDDAALDETGQTDKLAELALEVELVALTGDQIDVSLAGIDQLKEIINVDVAQRPYCTH